MATHTLKTFELNGVQIDPEKWSTEFVQHMIEQAARVKVQRCTANMKDETEEKREAERVKTAEEIKAGKIPAGGGRGSSLTPEDKALRDCLSAKAKRLKGESLEDHLERITKELAKAQGKDFDAGMVEKVKAHLVASDLYKTKLKEYRTAGKVTKPSLGDLDL